jgi:Flagellar hook capping protein
MTMVNPISALTAEPVAATQAQPPAQTQTGSMDKNYEMFLKLLVTQIRNQDPLSPMDPTQFVQQTATLTQVEQLAKSNQSLANLQANLSAALMRMDIGYIGKIVEASVDRFAFDGDRIDLAYAAPGADSVVITISDKDGNVVRTINAVPGSGRQELVWDGSLDGGGKAASGDYRIDITAKDKDGNAVDSLVVVQQRVKEVVPGLNGGESTLILEGGGKVSPSDIITIGA